jgi:two-component system, response regulator
MSNEAMSRHHCIFIADDDSDDVYFVESAIKDLGENITLKHFVNGRDLLDQLKNTGSDLPGLILLDLNMPILDGKETLKRIRKDTRLNSIPVVILTTSSLENEKENCIDFGANNYFTKPYTYSHYVDIFRQLKTEWLDNVLANT